MVLQPSEHDGELQRETIIAANKFRIAFGQENDFDKTVRLTVDFHPSQFVKERLRVEDVADVILGREPDKFVLKRGDPCEAGAPSVQLQPN